MAEHFHAGLGAQAVQHELQRFRVERRDVVMAGRDPGRKGRPGADVLRVDRAAEPDHPADDLVEEAADDLDLSGGVETGHERRDKAARGHATQAAALLDEHRVHAEPGRGNRRAHAGGTAAHHQHFRLV